MIIVRPAWMLQNTVGWFCTVRENFWFARDVEGSGRSLSLKHSPCICHVWLGEWAKSIVTFYSVREGNRTLNLPNNGADILIAQTWFSVLEEEFVMNRVLASAGRAAELNCYHVTTENQLKGDAETRLHLVSANSDVSCHFSGELET
jgi:hypothetical protein